MTDVRDLLACPACRGALSPEWTCRCCGRQFDAADGIPNLRLEGDARTDAVRRFYDRAPFPAYSQRDTLSTLYTRAARSAFAQRLDRAIPGDACIADVGCGTGQMSLYLARADRRIVAADLSRAALTLGAEASSRYGVHGVQFVETDLQHPGLKPAAFDVVYSSGVLHHTPDSSAAFAYLAALARPGGMVVVGVYNAIARLPLRVRRGVARLAGFRVVPFDPVLRERHLDSARRDAWLRDQYHHPEEHSHTLAEVKRWFRQNHVEYFRSFPTTVLEDEHDDLFERAVDDWDLEGWLAQIGWMWTLGHEGGLFFTIGRRQ